MLARLDIDLAKRLGESVDPRVEMIARADLSSYDRHVARATPTGATHRPVVWLDTETGEVVDPSEDGQGTAEASSNGSASDGEPSDKAS
ncbi:MAG: hypothetical protein H0U62_06475 [Actinobacteria bacterium]|nr:hypothetical protein [Actinomycetota bacterium]